MNVKNIFLVLCLIVVTMPILTAQQLLEKTLLHDGELIFMEGLEILRLIFLYLICDPLRIRQGLS